MFGRRGRVVHYEWKEVPSTSEHTFSLTAGIVFLLIALGHLARIIMGLPVVVQGVSVPVWASVVALVVTAFLSYEGFHFARRAPPKG
jgi:hypothetical protein